MKKKLYSIRVKSLKESKYRVLQRMFIVAYIVIILWYTVLDRSISLQSAQIELFWSYKLWFQGDWGIGKQIINNIILFVPLGFLCSSFTGEREISTATLVGALLSCLIEALQYSFMRGLFEFDDVLNNTLGALIGGIIFIGLSKRLRFYVTRLVVVGIGCISVIMGFVICCFSSKNEADTSFRQYCFQIDEVTYSDNLFRMTGFGFRYDGANMPIQITLKSNHQSIPLYVESGIKRRDVEDYFSCGTDYSNTGFRATTSKIIENEEYEILVNFGWPILIPTGVYITGSNVHYIPSALSNPPDIDADFVVNGTLLVYRPDYYCWVYQYDGSLYWIADRDFFFEDDGSTYIQYQLWTTQTEKLPQHRLDNRWLWDNLGGYFEEYEVQGLGGSYRVMERKLPTEYSITAITTGYFTDDKWIWENCFRPFYEFN